jgi:hypothetical protein
MAKQRSPNYPKFDLDTAITKADQVYKAEHTHAADKEVVARDLGYSSLNGASLTTIGALNSYGLLEPEGEGLKVSEDAVTILELPKGDPERLAALKRRAFAPRLFMELKQEFGDNLPSDVNLRHSLIKRRFLPKGADEAIRVYRETLKFVSDEAKEYNAPDAGEPTGQSTPAGGSPMPGQQSTPATPSWHSPTKEELNRLLGAPEQTQGKELRFNISRDSEAQVIFHGPVTQEAIDKLAKLLELQKDTFPTRAELVRPRTAIWRNKDHDQPVTITGELGEKNGKRFYAAKETGTGIPEDELVFEDVQAKGAA